MSIEIGQIYISEGVFGSVDFFYITRVSEKTVWYKRCDMHGFCRGEELRTPLIKVAYTLGIVLTNDKINKIKHQNNMKLFTNRAKTIAQDIAHKISSSGCQYPQLVAEQLQAILDKL